MLEFKSQHESDLWAAVYVSAVRAPPWQATYQPTRSIDPVTAADRAVLAYRARWSDHATD